MNTLAKLELPKRWELLEQRAEAAGLDTSLFVERVDSAADRIDYLLQRVKTGGGGLFEVFYGLSGSGKTTFLKTLPKQFQRIRVLSFPKDKDLRELPTFIHDMHVPGDASSRVILVERRDNPSQQDMQSLSETGSPPFSRTLTRRPMVAMRSVHVEAKEVQFGVQAGCG